MTSQKNEFEKFWQEKIKEYNVSGDGFTHLIAVKHMVYDDWRKEKEIKAVDD